MTETKYALRTEANLQEGVPTGRVTTHEWHDSRIYPATSGEYWVYVPAQYTDKEPACVMVFQDGEAYLHAEGSVRATTVFDNLIHKREMPVTIGIFINPGKKVEPFDQRNVQYTSLSDAYANFLLEEILPEVGRYYNLVDNAAGRAICGMSDGGLCAFTVGWERPDAFSKIVSHIGSFTRLRGGSEYPYQIRRTRGNPKPIRVFLQDGLNDLNITEGNWTLANLSMDSALMFARYDYRLDMGSGGHDLNHGGAIFPETLRWLWRDYPFVVNEFSTTHSDAVVGTWKILTNVLGVEYRSELIITTDVGELTAVLNDENDGTLDITAVSFKDDVLCFEYMAPKSQMAWGKGSGGTMSMWAKVKDRELEGVLSRDADTTMDFSVMGRRFVED